MRKALHGGLDQVPPPPLPTALLNTPKSTKGHLFHQLFEGLAVAGLLATELAGTHIYAAFVGHQQERTGGGGGGGDA